MTEVARAHLLSRFPAFEPLLDRIGLIPELSRSRESVPEAVVRIVISQMLSGQAADTIYSRVTVEARRRQLTGSWLLGDAALRASGVSGRKIRTIRQFRNAYRKNKATIDGWKRLTTEALFEEVASFWGMSHWTASMLAIFHFAHEDVFPHSDGSLTRAVKLCAELGVWDARMHGTFEPLRAAPFRSYLALYLWRALDGGLLKPTAR
jgi:DNA-3-methyladenine glycosylase II